MKLNVKALAMTSAIAWGGCLLLIAVANLVLPAYGESWLQLAQSIYPGYNGPAGLGSVMIVTLYGALDGALLGAVIAWLYNRFAATNHGTTAA
tara:strand:- start:54 stop:332 length:279 start_codon:yes stop_codon:yes gene_type:complete